VNSWVSIGTNPSAGWVIYDNGKPNAKSIKMVQLPISLYDPGTEMYSFGVINLEIYN
jgi:hypothetical protein